MSMLTVPKAETSGGGLALWGSDGSFGNLRTGDQRFHQAWLPWITAIGRIIAKNEIGNGGVSVTILASSETKNS